MKTIKKLIKNLTQSPEELYLSRAVDLADLERRMKRIERGRISDLNHFPL